MKISEGRSSYGYTGSRVEKHLLSITQSEFYGRRFNEILIILMLVVGFPGITQEYANNARPLRAQQVAPIADTGRPEPLISHPLIADTEIDEIGDLFASGHIART